MQEIDLRVIVRIATALVLIAAVSVVSAVTVDIRNYGKCLVVSEIDEFEDKMLFHLLFCNGRTDEWLSVSCNEFKNVLSLKPTGSHFPYEEQTKVRYRFDKHKYVTERWFWENNRQTANYEAGDSELNRFLHRIASSERLIFGIGNVRGEINFGAETADAVDDFKGRCP